MVPVTQWRPLLLQDPVAGESQPPNADRRRQIDRRNFHESSCKDLQWEFQEEKAPENFIWRSPSQGTYVLTYDFTYSLKKENRFHGSSDSELVMD